MGQVAMELGCEVLEIILTFRNVRFRAYGPTPDIIDMWRASRMGRFGNGGETIR